MRHQPTVKQLLSLVPLLLFAGCGGSNGAGFLPFMGHATPSENEAPAFADLSDAGSQEEKSPIAPGIWLSVNVNNSPDLSRVVRVSASGDIGLPQIGKVHVGGLTGPATERAIRARLQQSGEAVTKVKVAYFQPGPVFVLGEVQKAGEFAYKDGVALADLIDQAGGLTYRADSRRVFITRYNQPDELEMPVTRSTQVMPGDVIRVPQRYF